MMLDEHAHHGIDATLAVLSEHDPGPVRVAQTRTRCHAALRKEAARTQRAGGGSRQGWTRVLEPALVGSLSIIYLFEVLSRALQLYRF